MDILAALRQEEQKFERQLKATQQQLETIRAAMKVLGRNGANSNAVEGKKRRLSTSARANISKATKMRWAKYRAAKAKGKKQ
jgi:hypothetical protein